MNARLFGRTGHTVGEIGLGCWQLGGTDWTGLSELRARSILIAAADSGVNFFDTADVYGSGRSEEALGRLLKERKEDIEAGGNLRLASTAENRGENPRFWRQCRDRRGGFDLSGTAGARFPATHLQCPATGTRKGGIPPRHRERGGHHREAAARRWTARRTSRGTSSRARLPFDLLLGCWPERGRTLCDRERYGQGPDAVCRLP